MPQQDASNEYSQVDNIYFCPEIRKPCIYLIPTHISTTFICIYFLFQHFENPDEAQAAADALDNSPFEGVNLKVEVIYSTIVL